jgi:hypothetical protein
MLYLLRILGAVLVFVAQSAEETSGLTAGAFGG